MMKREPSSRHAAPRTRRFMLAGVTAVMLAVLARPAAAELSVDQASTFIVETSRALTAAVNEQSDVKVKSATLEKIIDDSVDIAAVGRFCLGRFWRVATPEQQKDYLDLFHRVMVLNITARVGEYEGVTIAVIKGNAREDGVAVTTTVTRPNNAPNRVDWLVSAESGRPRVIDVIAEGTSLRLTQRNDYLSFMSRNSNNIQALIDALRQQAATTK